jgi:hypothetical protein
MPTYGHTAIRSVHKIVRHASASFFLGGGGGHLRYPCTVLRAAIYITDLTQQPWSAIDPKSNQLSRLMRIPTLTLLFKKPRKCR